MMLAREVKVAPLRLLMLLLPPPRLTLPLSVPKLSRVSAAVPPVRAMPLMAETDPLLVMILLAPFRTMMPTPVPLPPVTEPSLILTITLPLLTPPRLWATIPYAFAPVTRMWPELLTVTRPDEPV